VRRIPGFRVADGNVQRQSRSYSKRGFFVRHDHQGLPPDERTCRQVWREARYPGFSLQSVWHQENGDGDEILQNLKHVRPGEGYEPKLVLMEKCLVNGEGTHPVFDWLKSALPAPHDDPEPFMANPLFITWAPVKRSDISWNFEKFLISPAGAPVKRYSRNFITEKIGEDIDQLLKA